MEIVKRVLATEQEIVEIINNHLGLSIDSLVAMEELGNEVLSMEGITGTDGTENSLEFMAQRNFNFYLRDLMNMLVDQKSLPSGDYLIDCTW